MFNKLNVVYLNQTNSKYISINITKKCIYLENNNSKNILKNLNIKTLKEDDIKNKKFYRYPKISLPRVKLDLLKEKLNISITRKKDDADYLIISNKRIDSLINYSYAIIIKAPTLLHSIEKYSHHFTIDCYNDFKKILNDNIDDLFVIKQAYSYGSITFADSLSYSNYLYVSEENSSEFMEIVNSKNLVLDNNLNNLIYKDMHILTKEEYINARNMIKSNDLHNRELALELLSNCNLTKSFDYISLLFYFYYNYLKDAGNWNSVNVKTLRENLSDFKPVYSNTTYGNHYDYYLKKLVDYNQLTEFAFKEVATYAFRNVIKTRMNITDESVITLDVNAIKINPSYLNNLKNKLDFLNI